MQLPRPANDYSPAWANQLTADLERKLSNTAADAARGFTPTSAAKRRTFDTSTVTLSELAEVVATLIDDMGDAE